MALFVLAAAEAAERSTLRGAPDPLENALAKLKLKGRKNEVVALSTAGTVVTTVPDTVAKVTTVNASEKSL